MALKKCLFSSLVNFGVKIEDINNAHLEGFNLKKSFQNSLICIHEHMIEKYATHFFLTFLKTLLPINSPKCAKHSKIKQNCLRGRQNISAKTCYDSDLRQF